MSELFERIKSLCVNRGVNITEMCKQAGVSRSSLTDLNKGRIQTLTAETLSKIGRYLGVSVDELLGEEIPCWDEAMPHELIHVAEDHHFICVAIKYCEERADNGKMRVKCIEPGVVSVLISPLAG